MSFEKLIDTYLNKNRDEIIFSLSNFVKIPSILDKSHKKYPYGLQCAAALDFCEELCNSKGLWTHNEKYIYLEAKLKENQQGKKILFAAHADIVPAEDENIYAPYGGEIVNNYVIGRGAVDDKGPLIAILYALAFFKENHISLKNDIGLFLGSNEEMGMDDLEYYLKVNGQPDFGIAVDDDFPVTNGEKGLIRFILSGKKSKYIKEALSYGQPQRLKDNVCRVITENSVFEVIKDSNAVKAVLLKLNEAGVPILESSHCNSLLIDIINDTSGKVVNCYGADEVSGETQLNLYKLSSNYDTVEFYFDLRLPVTQDEKTVLRSLQTYGKKNNFTIEVTKVSPSYFISEDEEIITLLTNLYNKYTKSQDKPYVMSGCTYARLFKKGCGFGAGNPHEVKPFPKGHGAAHGADEAHNIDVLLHAIKIYILGIKELDEFFIDKI